MAIFAGLPSNLFPSTPPNPRINDPTTSKPISLPIPIPKYPKQVKNRTPKPNSSDAKPNPAFKTIHRRTKYYKPISDGVIAEEDDRSVILGESGVSYLLPGAPFEFQFSYSETPKVKPLAIREPAFLPFAPPTMPRPWTGKAPLKKSKKKIPLFDSFNPSPFGSNGVKQLEMPGPLKLGKYSKEDKSREEVLGRPLSRDEIRKMVKPLLSSNRQLNLGRDGLTHNMLEMVHTHWKRQEVCKVRCRGVPTVDMDNVCYHLEEKTGGRIIHRAGGVLYLFRGRNYNYRTRPQYPIMLWKPAAPVYPKLIQEAPEGLTKKEADDLRKKGEKLLPICKLAKNGIYINLVKEVRNAFESSALVKINCQGLHASDYKKIGAKLKVLVPCVLLSFDQEQILIWRGKEWKSRYPRPLSIDSITNSVDGVVPVTRDDSDGLIDTDGKLHGVRSSRMISLWRHAVESSKALVLDDLNLSPDALLEKVEMFVGMSQAMEHSYPALILPNTEPNQLNDRDSYESDLELEDDDEESASFEDVEESIPRGSLPVDSIVKRFDLE